MEIVSLNIERPKVISYQGRMVTSSIFQQPVQRRLRVTALTGKLACLRGRLGKVTEEA
jgi:MOSC domain-containing protein YiiM